MTFEEIRPNPIDIDDMLETIRRGVQRQAKFSNTQFGLTYKTWQHKPKFEECFDENNREMAGSALTSGRGSKNNPYPFVTKGTSVRYATMSGNFQPKSQPRVIGSSRGRGKVLVVDKRRPRPGIKAREFEQEIAKREQPRFKDRMERALGNAADDSGHAI